MQDEWDRWLYIVLLYVPNTFLVNIILKKVFESWYIYLYLRLLGLVLDTGPVLAFINLKHMEPVLQIQFLVARQNLKGYNTYLGPVVQSVVSLMSSLRVISLTVLADSIYNILIFFAEKMWVAFALQKLLIFFQQKISAYLRITRSKF